MGKTKFDNFCARFNAKHAKIAFVLMVCFAGTLTLIFAPNWWGSDVDANPDQDPPINQGVVGECGNLVPSGTGHTRMFSLREIDFVVLEGMQVQHLLNICNEDAIVSWDITNPEVVRVTFFPFTIHAQAEGMTEITITARRRIGTVTQYVTLTTEIAVY